MKLNKSTKRLLQLAYPLIAAAVVHTGARHVRVSMSLDIVIGSTDEARVQLQRSSEELLSVQEILESATSNDLDFDSAKDLLATADESAASALRWAEGAREHTYAATAAANVVATDSAVRRSRSADLAAHELILASVQTATALQNFKEQIATLEEEAQGGPEVPISSGAMAPLTPLQFALSNALRISSNAAEEGVNAVSQLSEVTSRTPVSP